MPPKKNPDGNPSRNAITLFSMLLFSGRAYSLKRLAEILECSRQTVLRLVEQIEMSGRVGLRTWTEGGQKYYQIQTPSTRPKVVLSPREVEQLVLCREWLHHLLPQGVRQSIEQATEKSTVLLDDYACRPEALTPLGQSAVKGRIDYEGFEDILHTLTSAIRRGQVVEAEYKSPLRAESRIHIFVPTRLVAYREALYVRGWSVAPRGLPEPLKPITLAVHRLLRAEPTRRMLSPEVLRTLPAMDETEYFGLSQQTGPFRVLARFFGGGARYVRERQWSKDYHLQEEEDGVVLLSFTAQSDMEVVKWILGFGADAQLLEPAPLRDRVLEELRTALERYAKK